MTAEHAIRNLVRLEANSLTDAINLLVKYSKVYYKVDLRIDSYPARFGIARITHSCPLGKKTNWGSDIQFPVGHLGWSGTWKGEIRGSYKSFFSSTDRPSLSDYLDKSPAFYGFHTGTGSGGDNFDISGEIFLEDFPKMYSREIKRLEGNHLCCKVNREALCPFCKMSWCADHYKILSNAMTWVRCPFDGYKL